MAETDEQNKAGYQNDGDTGEVTPDIQAQIDMDERAAASRIKTLNLSASSDSVTNMSVDQAIVVFNDKDITTWPVPAERTLPSDQLPSDGYHIQLNPGHAFSLGELGLLQQDDIYEVYDQDSPGYKQRVAVLDVRTFVDRLQSTGNMGLLTKVIYFVQQENVQNLNLQTAMGSLDSLVTIKRQLEDDNYKQRMQKKLDFIKSQAERVLIIAAASENFIDSIPPEARSEQIQSEIEGLQVLINRNYLLDDNEITLARNEIFSYLFSQSPSAWVKEYRAQYPLTR